MIVIDTHIWVWYKADRARLSQSQLNILAQTEGPILVSAISMWELAHLLYRGRIETGKDPRQWIDDAVTLDRLEFVDLTPPIVCDAMSLPGDFHKDPADRLIVATAGVLDAPLLTADGAILRYPHVQTVGRSDALLIRPRPRADTGAAASSRTY